jgi:DUF1680 family protein
VTGSSRYNAGHLIEAALAHHLYYKNDDLLSPILKYVDLFVATFGDQDGQLPGYPGHPEIELALLRLYKVTGNPEHLKLAQFFIEERGNQQGGKEKRHYYDVEAEARGENEHELPMCYPAARSYWYQQAHKPIAEQETIEGHSVRAMYLLTAVADLVRIHQPTSETGAKFLPALHRLWSNMIEQKSYVTGGIGAIKKWEGFGIDYFLPHGTDEGGCYAETCAAIGVMMLAERLLRVSYTPYCKSVATDKVLAWVGQSIRRYHGAVHVQCCSHRYEPGWKGIHLREPVGLLKRRSFRAP